MKTRKCMGKKFGFAKYCFMLILMILCLAVPAQAAEKKIKYTKDARKAYMTYIKRYKDKGGSDGAHYRIVDVNLDGTKECIVNYKEGQYLHVIILTYRDGKVRRFYEKRGITDLRYNSARKRLFITVNGGVNSQKVSFLYGFNGKKIVRKAYYTYSAKRLTNPTRILVSCFRGKTRISYQKYLSYVQPIIRGWRNLAGGAKVK